MVPTIHSLSPPFPDLQKPLRVALTGVRTMDQQHLELVTLIEAFEQAHCEGETVHALHDIFPHLEAYAVFHFAEEEVGLRSLRGEVTFVQTHLAAHRAFLEQIRAWRDQAVSSNSVDTAERLRRYLREWLVHHIATADVALGRKLAAAPGKATPWRTQP